MNYTPLTYVLSAGFMCIVAFSGGAAITSKLVDNRAALEVLTLGAGWMIAGIAGLIWFRRYARHRAVGYLFFMALFANMSLMPVLFALALPIFRLHGVFSSIGGALICFFLATLCYQLYRGYLHFAACWQNNHEKALADLYNPHLQVIYIQPFLRRLHVQSDLFLPVASDLLKGLISIVLVVSMIIGLNLRNMFPTFSAFAWGIPALTATTLCLQIAFLHILLAFKILELERTTGTHIGPMADAEIQRTKSRKRKTKSR